MKGPDLLEMAGRNLRESFLRNSLTTLGIGVGVASLVAMLSLGAGLQQLANRRLMRTGLFETVVVFPRQEFRGFGARPARAGAPSQESRPLDKAARREFEKLPNVVEVYPEIRIPSEVRYGGHTRPTIVAGVAPSARTTDAFEGLQGHFFSGSAAEEAILQMEFARDLSTEPSALIGKDLTISYAERQPLEGKERSPPATKAGGKSAATPWGFSVVRREKSLRVVGIVTTEPNAGFQRFGRGRVFIPIQLAEWLNAPQLLNLLDALRAPSSGPTYLSLIVRVSGPAQLPAVEEAIKRMGYGTFSLLDATQNLRRFFVVLDLFLGIFGSLALAVASLGVINTLLMAILERQREIGIMKAVGASDMDIRRLFFAEAGAMGAAGGALGVAIGWTLGRVINFGVNIYLRRQDLPPETIWWVPWWLVAGAIGFSVFVSLAAGLYPAARAAKLDPVQTLRFE